MTVSYLIEIAIVNNNLSSSICIASIPIKNATATTTTATTSTNLNPICRIPNHVSVRRCTLVDFIIMLDISTYTDCHTTVPLFKTTLTTTATIVVHTSTATARSHSRFNYYICFLLCSVAI